MQDCEIRITRRRGFADALRAYRIYVDGVRMGKIRLGGTVELRVPPGRHRVVVRIDWARSNFVEVDCRPGAPQCLECGSNLAGMRLLLAGFYALFLPHKYLRLSRVEASPDVQRYIAARAAGGIPVAGGRRDRPGN